MSKTKTILYVGGFVLPDGNAAAQRVLANARLFSAIGYNVAMINYSESALAPRQALINGIECFDFPSSMKGIASSADINFIQELLSKRSDIGYVIAYNYPALPLIQLMKLCRAKRILCVGDVTEWYRARDVPLHKMAAKYFDTTVRMRWLLPRMDGLIVISNYLERYYQGLSKVTLLPPLIDASDKKWRQPIFLSNDGVTRLVYAGKPSRTKERLDLMVDAVRSLPDTPRVVLDIVGITDQDFRRIYGWDVVDPRVIFHGRVSHEDAISFVKLADYSLIIRDDNLVTRAGFPTKFVESVTCGTPVICNDNSDLKTWVDKCNCGFLVEASNLRNELMRVLSANKPKFDKNIFDYRNYLSQIQSFFSSISDKRRIDA